MQNSELSYYGADNTGGKNARKYIAPIQVSGSSDTITFEFDFNWKQDIDMNNIKMVLEDSTAGTGFYIRYYERQKDLLVRQYSPLNGTSDIYVDLNLYISLDVWSNCKLVIDGVLGKVKFYFNGDLKSTVNLDPEIASVNSVKLIINEAHYHIDNIIVSNTAYKPYIYKDTFDDGLYGQYVTYYYDSSDQRVMKVDGSGVTRYIINSNAQVLAEYDGNGSLKYKYIYGNGQRLARVYPGGAKEYYHNDYQPVGGQALGSARRINNSSGNVVWRRDYYPFGESRTASGVSNKYMFTGKERDLETESDNSWHRQYLYKLGRFSQVDPLWYKYPGWSPYVYALNNPLRYVDPEGKDIRDAQGNPLTFSQKIRYGFDMMRGAYTEGMFTPKLTSTSYPPDPDFIMGYSVDRWTTEYRGLDISLSTFFGNKSDNAKSEWFRDKINVARIEAGFRDKSTFRIALSGQIIVDEITFLRPAKGGIDKGVFVFEGSIEDVKSFLNDYGWELRTDDTGYYEVIPIEDF